MNLFRCVCTLFTWILAPNLLAASCLLTAVKPACWANYTVFINILDAQTQRKLTDITLSTDKLWNRVRFECEPGQRLAYQASFKPAIWQGQEHAIYQAQKFWLLPTNKALPAQTWEIQLCFPTAFAEVPMPPLGNQPCACDFKAIPTVKLKSTQ